MPTDREQREQAGRTLRGYAWGLNRPFYREEDGELRKTVEGSLWLRGIVVPKLGPGFVMVSSHYAIPLTAGTRDTRVGGGGLVFTGRLERPRSPVDLRPQARAKEIHALTRDGIPIKVFMVAVFQVDLQEAEGEELHPFDPQAVFAAVRAQGVDPGQEEESGELGWDQIVVDRAADLLRAAIARTLLDRLLESGDEDDEKGKPPREALRAAVKVDLAQAMEPHGIDVIGVGLGNIEVEDEKVLRQRAESWRARWERRRVEKEAQGDAEAIRLIEEARVDAQRQMIGAVTEAFQQLADAETPVPAHVIALRFIDVLENVAASPPVQELLPETVQVLPAQLRLLVERSTTGHGGEDAQ
jgi:regulator of protease activity HflC (stomatin/prohibitin superfamily)